MQANIIIFVPKPPEIEIKNGIAYVRDLSGEGMLERAMSPHTLRAYAERAIRLLAEFEAEQHEPVELRRSGE